MKLGRQALILIICLLVMVTAAQDAQTVQSNTGSFIIFVTDFDGSFSCTVSVGRELMCNPIDDDFSPKDVALGDVNLDGISDLFLAHSAPLHSRICPGLGAGRFGPCRRVMTNNLLGLNPAFTSGAAIGDVNGDTLPDVVVANNNVDLSSEVAQHSRVCFGEGSIFISSCANIDVSPQRALDVALSDISGDGILDAVFGMAGENRTCINRGNGNFNCRSIDGGGVPFGSQGVALGDLNGDTFVDAVFANSISFDEGVSNDDIRSRVCLGNGAGGFTCSDLDLSASSFGSNEWADGVAIADINGDEQPDLIIAGTNRNPLCIGNGAGGFDCSRTIDDVGPSQDVAVGDVDSDGFLDVVFVNSFEPNRICFGDMDANFSCQDVTLPANSSAAVVIGTFGD